MPILMLAMFSMAQAMPPLHVDGPDLKSPDGQVVHLRGCNLGNWFMIEHWIWDQNQPEGSSQDQFELENLLAKRFGESDKDRLMDEYRNSWITDRDFDVIQSFRFNCVRLPLNYRMFEDDANPMHLRSDAWMWTDKAISMAGKHGIYVILDMHGVQGGQSEYDHTGRAHQNKLWTSREDQERMAWLWSQVAAKYRDNPTVIAYDVFNEPYGGEKSQIRQVWEKSYNAIRKVDKDKLVYAMGRYDGFDMYGDPKANGWHNVGIEMHYYPGLFGNGNPTVERNMENIATIKRDVVPVVKQLNVPFYIGEMNVVFDSAGGASMMRRTYDSYDSNGWPTTMWTYKILGRSGAPFKNGWGMVSNRDPIAKINFAKASEADIEQFFKSNATMAYAVNTDLQKEMAPVHVDLPPVAEPTLRTDAAQDELSGWTNSDVGNALKGGLEKNGERFTLIGGGADIWADHDQFQFLNKQVSGDFELSVRIDREENLGSYCKGGLMVRNSLDPTSAFALVSIFPSGEVQTAVRTSDGGTVQGTTPQAVGFPVELRIGRHGDQWTCFCRKADTGNWTKLAFAGTPDLGQKALCGPIALSHDNNQLIKISYSHLVLHQN